MSLNRRIWQQPGQKILSCSPPMFSSRLLYSLIRTHPAVLLVLWGPVILALAVYGIRQVGSLVAIGLMAAGASACPSPRPYDCPPAPSEQLS
jgi:hypothetical protein